MTDTLSLTPVFSVERPPQADASFPSLVAGVQVAHRGLQAPYIGASSTDVTLKPLSLQVTGVGRRLEANTGGPTNAAGGQPNLNSQTYVTGWGSPRVCSSRCSHHGMERRATRRTIVMEGVTGAGIADFFNGLSWGSATRRAARPPRTVALAAPPLARPTSMPAWQP